MGSQVSGAEALNIRPDLAVFPQVCMFPSPSTATLATEGQEEHVMVRKKKGANLQAGRCTSAHRGLGYLQLTICASTNSSIPCPV